MESNYILEKIKSLLEKKKEKKIVPLNITYAELSNEISNDVRKELNKLYKEKKITVKNGINNKLIEITDE